MTFSDIALFKLFLLSSTEARGYLIFKNGLTLIDELRIYLQCMSFCFPSINSHRMAKFNGIQFSLKNDNRIIIIIIICC